MTLINVSLKKPKNKLNKISKLHHWDCRNKKIKVMITKASIKKEITSPKKPGSMKTRTETLITFQ